MGVVEAIIVDVVNVRFLRLDRSIVFVSEQRTVVNVWLQASAVLTAEERTVMWVREATNARPVRKQCVVRCDSVHTSETETGV